MSRFVKHGTIMLPPLDTMADEYVQLLDEQPNAWGQNVHATYGISHNMLYLMQVQYGVAETQRAIDAAFLSRKSTG